MHHFAFWLPFFPFTVREFPHILVEFFGNDVKSFAHLFKEGGGNILWCKLLLFLVEKMAYIIL